MSSIVSIDTRGYDISMGPGVLRVGGGGGLAGNVYINGNVGIGVINPTVALDVAGSASAYNIPKRWQSDILIGGSYSGGLARYYLLGTLKDNNVVIGYGTMNIQGTLGGFTNDSISVIDAMITTRGGLKTSGLLKYYGSNGNDICDIVVYYTGTGTTTGPRYFVYLKTNIQLSPTVFIYFDLAVTTGFNSTSQTTNAVWIAEPSNTFITTTPTGTNVITSLIASIGNDLTINTNGNVGIGTTTPAYTLDVNGGFRTTGALELAKSVATPNTYIEVSSRLFDFHTGATLIDYDSRIIASGGTGVTAKGTIQIEAANIGLIGDVGIGTSTPTSKLEVSGTITASRIISVSGESFEGTVTNVDNFTSSSIILNTTGTPSGKSFIGSRGINGGGGVGFVFSRGASFQTQVQVYTNVSTVGNTVTGSLSTPGPYVASGGTSWTTSSDERLKDNITELPDDTLDIISNIHAVKFTWKNDTLNKKCIGFIAQNVQEYYPEVVNNNSSSGYLGVDYTSMIPVLLKSIQQLKTKLDDALQRIQTLESK